MPFVVRWPGTIPTLHNMAYLALQSGDPNKAMSLWVEALQAARATGNAEGLFEVSRALGAVLAQAGRAKEARPLFAEALEVGAKLDRPECAEVAEQLRQLDAPKDSDEGA